MPAKRTKLKKVNGLVGIKGINKCLKHAHNNVTTMIFLLFPIRRAAKKNRTNEAPNNIGLTKKDPITKINTVSTKAIMGILLFNYFIQLSRLTFNRDSN